MTTKIKIIIGFFIIIFLQGGMAALGYLDIQNASDGFVSYRRQSNVNVACSDLVARLTQATSKTYEFLSSEDNKLIADALAEVEALENIARTAGEETHIQYRKEGFARLLQQGPALRAAITAVKEGKQEVRRQYEQVRAGYHTMTDRLNELAKACLDLHNYEALFLVTSVWDNFAHCISALGRFSESASEADGTSALQRLNSMEPSIAKLEAQLQTPTGARLIAAIKESYATQLNMGGVMVQRARDMRENVAALHNIESTMSAFITEFNSRVNSEMHAEGNAMLTDNSRTQRIMLISSIAGVLIGVLTAALIIIGIVRVLRDLAGFGRAIASGNFTYAVKTREGGEIGSMVEAMRNIPATLQRIIDAGTKLANDIRVGKLRERLDTAIFPGSFADLAVSVNAVGTAYTEILDALPVPLMACDKSFTVAFYNKAGQSVVGGNLVGTQCKDNFGAPECYNDKCFGRNCMERKSAVSQETRVEKGGKVSHLSVTAVPLTDMSGNVAGCIEILSDLTEIRTQQATMMAVATQASEISNRVAAASEELSAQVEQVSRGAEMQRSRVESTASAMTQMNSTVLEVARNAGQASEQSDMTRSKAQDGAGLVNEVVHSINMVNQVATNLQGNMQELGQQAESIGGVMNVISDIADQTNLLALNAAIEAARAGEAGRGFAVVADEVRKLAEKTMSATHEVGANIDAIQQSARSNIDEVGKAVQSIGEATSLANSSGEALSEIVNLASANSAVVSSIATAAEEQSATSEEINRAIEEINHVVGETTEGMIQSSAAVQELSHMAQELRHVMEGLR